MPRYIDADALTDELQTFYRSPISTEDFMTIGYDKAIADVVITIHRQPTADVVERKKGKWIDYPIADGCLQCSVCGILRFEEANYCPNCGAEMKGEDNGLD